MQKRHPSIRAMYREGNLAVGTCLLLLGCSKPAAKIPEKMPVVTVIRPIMREVMEWDEYIGRLESPQTVEI